MEIIVVLLIVVAAVAAVLVPLVRRGGDEPLETPGTPSLDDASLEAEVVRYRAALRSGSLCRRCGEANPGGSRFCAACGRALDSEAA
jgi:hypothetical protein